ncbi:hypothetical protein RJ639_027138 [Escallonia herrerae]|uniref:Ninja-family protein n=1 Tax=Escallonia herrerae TaxID=1293975 RepID=A0AA89BF27_9ASTE|nr:hypothetical protein RJ639_027138 [Escallonia herrerae]
MDNLSLQPNRFPRDLLQRFMTSGSSGSSNLVVKEEADVEEIELNLGLSLGGRFGVDKSGNSKLVRSSSIAGPIGFYKDDGGGREVAAAAVECKGLARTASLPVETEEEWRKRKELQTLRRMEAKRRRSEKQRSSKDGGCGGGDGGGDERREIEVGLRGRKERAEYIAAMNKVGSSFTPQFGLPSWARPGFLGGGSGGGGVQPSSQGSVESRGGSSSSLSEMESKPLQGSSSCGEASPCSIHASHNRCNQDAVGGSGAKIVESTSKPSGAQMESPPKISKVTRNRGTEIGTNSLEDMPCVFTKGDGPNGRRIEGILYKYGRGEEVRIMCVCHGSFHSPAEFVKHAGGSDVAHPLKHIVVNRNSASFQ